MPITEALKKLIKTITGKDAAGETIEELVQNLNDNYPEGGSGGGGGSITVEDKITEGSTNPVEGGAIYDEFEDVNLKINRALPLVVHGEWADPNTVTITTSLADIYAAIRVGRAVLLEYTNDGTVTRMPLCTASENNGEYEFGFSFGFITSGKPAVAGVSFTNSLVGVFTMAVAQ